MTGCDRTDKLSSSCALSNASHSLLPSVVEPRLLPSGCVLWLLPQVGVVSMGAGNSGGDMLPEPLPSSSSFSAPKQASLTGSPDEGDKSKVEG